MFEKFKRCYYPRPGDLQGCLSLADSKKQHDLYVGDELQDANNLGTTS